MHHKLHHATALGGHRHFLVWSFLSWGIVLQCGTFLHQSILIDELEMVQKFSGKDVSKNCKGTLYSILSKCCWQLSS